MSTIEMKQLTPELSDPPLLRLPMAVVVVLLAIQCDSQANGHCLDVAFRSAECWPHIGLPSWCLRIAPVLQDRQ